ncbi:MAG: hypothetical protein HYY40_03015 [Bacteroidetes bacterium]|nr:hypothetical protein [Bacteroidota bacterium]
MNTFLVKTLLFLLPFFSVTATFFIFDPFKIWYAYDDYFSDYSIIINRDYAGTELYMQNRKKMHYDSFIFGSSRTLAFNTKDWKPYLQNNASPFVFWASGETLFGMWSKIKFLHSLNDTIKNSILVMDNGATLNRTGNSKGHIFIKHPLLSNGSRYEFYSSFVYAYMADFFFVRYLDYCFFKRYRPYMKGFIDERIVKSDPVTNDFYRISNQVERNRNMKDYYSKREKMFYARPQNPVTSKAIIRPPQLTMLKDIAEIFGKMGTQYKIVIGPMYDQKKFNAGDLEILYELFGKQNVFDYTGINFITESRENYYDDNHYMPHVGQKILKEIYSRENLNPDDKYDE